MKVPTLTELAREKIERLILDGALKPGDHVNLEGLARTFAISPTPFREALNRLEQERLVTYRPRAGWSVARISREAFLEYYEMQELLETALTVRAMPLLLVEDFERMETLNRSMEEGRLEENAVSVIDDNYEFHQTIYRRCPNSVMRATLEQIWKASHCQRRFMIICGLRNEVAELIREHERLIRALRRCEEPEVRAVMAAHFRTGLAALEKFFEIGE